MSETLRPARVLPPGATLKRELEARGWTQKDLAAILLRPEQAISEIINGEKRITPETAISFASAFGTSAEFWLHLQSNYELWQAQRAVSASTADPIKRKAKLYERAPVAELLKRGWIKKTSTVAALEREVLRFLRISSLDEPCQLAVAFRRSAAFSPERTAQEAWLTRVDAVATTKRSGRFKLATLKAGLPELLTYASTERSAAKALSWLAERGVAVAVVRHLPKTFTDGAAYWRDDGTPVVALSLRYDRVDSFWFTLLHEVGHIVLGHKGAHIDEDLGKRDNLPPDEEEANAFAEDLLIPRAKFDAWLLSHPRPRSADMVAFAGEFAVAPGIVLGRLHHRGAVHYSRCRDLLAPVREHLGSWVSP